MEFLNGGSLEWHLENKNFTEKEVVFYSAQILCGILFLHSKQIIHRDIKLANILLDSNGNAKLCDFGFATKISSRKSRYSYGTECFRSPESYDPHFLSYSLDFWSFGVCIFNMLTGELPFENEEMLANDSKLPDLNQTKAKKKSNWISSIYWTSALVDVKDTYSISKEACDFVSRLLNKNLNERLGNKENNEDIKNDPFFSSIEWNLLENGLSKPPIKPDVVYI
jgi:serine/threonine protein kinase